MGVSPSQPSRNPGRKRVLVHFELEGTRLVISNFVFVKMSERHIKNSKGMEEMSRFSKCASHSQALIGAVRAPICHYIVVPVNERGMEREYLQL